MPQSPKGKFAKPSATGRKPSPSTPHTSPARRESFGPTDVFESPVQWSGTPHFERDAAEIARMIDHGAIICRRKVSPRYIEIMLGDPTLGMWVVRDAKARAFGFALTRQYTHTGRGGREENSYLELELICTHKRKGGEGAQLFHNILAYSRDTQQELRLTAVNQRVAFLYADEARKTGHAILVADGKLPAPARMSRKRLTHAIKAQERLIPMRFVPP
tara:strand:+ start:50 stop:700 length:651 start_codon:yes stop_codon:yes gene_type:complete